MAKNSPEGKPKSKTKAPSEIAKEVAITPQPKPRGQRRGLSIQNVVEKMSAPKIAETAPIRAYEFDPDFKYKISKMPGGENLKQCFQCGTCTSDCPIARFSDSYRPRQIIRMAQLGLKNRVLSSNTLWLCAACFTCTDRCPQGVEVASVIRILRNAAIERGGIPPIFKELSTSIMESGIAYRIPELRRKKRKQIGLPPLPKNNIETMKKLANATGFSKTLRKGEQT